MKLKRLKALLVSSVLAITMLTGCATPSVSGDRETQESSQGSGETDADGKVTIRVVDWTDGNVEQRDAFHEKFMKENPDINVEYTRLTVDQFKNTIVTMIKSGEGPDIFPIPVGMTLNTALEENWFQSLNPYVTEEFEASFDPASFAEGVTHIGDEWYTITENMPTIQCLFYYNKDVLDAAGVKEIPKTYSEFREACKKITDNGNGMVYGMIDGGKQVNRMDVLARSLAAAAGGKIAATQKSINR